jgi:peptidoglycan hydrolase-like protein with peptidoglycan-binding domain
MAHVLLAAKLGARDGILPERFRAEDLQPKLSAGTFPRKGSKMGKRRVGTLLLSGITITVAALFTLSTTAASATTTTTSVPSHATAPSAAEATSGCVTETFTTADEPYYEACVNDAQILLNDLWYYQQAHPGIYLGANRLLTVDGSYGPNTAADVGYFQVAVGDKVDEKLGPQTWYSLCREDWLFGYTGTYWHDAGCGTESGL